MSKENNDAFVAKVKNKPLKLWLSIIDSSKADYDFLLLREYFLSEHNPMNIKAHNSIHPGEFIRRAYLYPLNITLELAAKKADMNLSDFYDLIDCQVDVNLAIALKLSKAFGRSPKSWMIMQENCNNYLDNLKQTDNSSP